MIENYFVITLADPLSRRDPIKPFHNDRLTYRLNIVAQEAIAVNDPVFIAETGCNLRELRVLRLICDNDGISFAEIAKMTGLERSLTSRLIQKLLKSGLIARRNSADDARVFHLSATELGHKVRARGRIVSNRLDAILTNPLSAHELEQLNDYLARLATWISAPDYRASLSAVAEGLSKDPREFSVDGA